MHPSDGQIEGYARRTLHPDELLEVDDHLGSCDACRARAAALAGFGAVADLQGELVPPGSHLSDVDVAALVDGSLEAGRKHAAERHTLACPACAREVEDLRAWARSRSRSPRIWPMAAAAAVLVLLLVPAAARWRSLRETDQRKPPGALAGLESLPREQRERVEAVLRAGVAEPPAYLAELQGTAESLMGETTTGAFQLIEPVGTVTVSDRPTFRWQPLAGAQVYVVSLADEGLRPIARSPRLSETAWSPRQALPRGRVYVWQVTAHRGTESLAAPAPPLPSAKFKVLDEETARQLEGLARGGPDAHLVLGILYAQAGARAEAIDHLGRVDTGDRHYETARRTLERLKATP